jgi:Spy/CpxP family protein refolding chaperone
MTSQAKVKLQVWLLIVVVFVLGGVTGGSLDRLYLSNRSWNPENRRGPHRMMERLKNDLNLNDEQVAKIKTIFEESRKEFGQRRLNECPGWLESRARTRSRIRETLTPEQQKRFDEINAHRDAEMSKER